MADPRFYEASVPPSKDFAKTIFLALVFSPAFLLLDHIHFQYNGPLFSILVFSLLEAPTSPLLSAFLFTCLLCFKHIYLYLAPAYFFYLLRTYCLGPAWRPQISNTVKLGIVVLGTLTVAFGPFVALRQIHIVFKRLFPFQRGLCHAYWAPNFWALYSFADRVAIQRKPCFGIAKTLSCPSSGARYQKPQSSLESYERTCWRYFVCSASWNHISHDFHHHSDISIGSF